MSSGGKRKDRNRATRQGVLFHGIEKHPTESEAFHDSNPTVAEEVALTDGVRFVRLRRDSVP